MLTLSDLKEGGVIFDYIILYYTYIILYYTYTNTNNVLM